MHVQRGENVPEGEQAQIEPVEQDPIQVEPEPEEPVQEELVPLQAQNNEPQPVELRRSDKVRRKPARYVLLGESYQVIAIDSEDDSKDDPINYKEALEDVDVQEWQKAMDREMESMYSNSVWSLVEAPKGVKPIGCKWIYKRKRGSDGKVKTFKARLVAKGKCCKCGQKGHWKQNCPQIAKKQGMDNLNVVEACLVENYNDKWIIDSGATNHVCYSLQWNLKKKNKNIFHTYF